MVSKGYEPEQITGKLREAAILLKGWLRDELAEHIMMQSIADCLFRTGFCNGPDILAPFYFIEVKYGEKMPRKEAQLGAWRIYVLGLVT